MSPAMNPHLKEIEADVLYHFGLDRTMDLPGLFGDVRVVCMGGSSDRMRAFAKKIATDAPEWNTDPHTLRPFGTTERFALYKVGPVLSVSHGMGIGSLRIMLHEITKLLHHAKVKGVQYIRIGTCGGIGVDPGTVILTTEALNPKLQARDEVVTLGKTHAYPTTFDPPLTHALEEQRGHIPVVRGKTVATNCFYEEQTRLDGAVDPGYTHAEQQAFLRRLYALGVRSYEMEATALAGFCNRAGIPTADASVVIVNRLQGDQVTSTHEELALLSQNAQTIVLRYLRQRFIGNHLPHPLSLTLSRSSSLSLGVEDRERECEYPTLPLLRDRTLPTAAFREAAKPIVHSLITTLHRRLAERKKGDAIVFVIILRAGLAFLDAAIQQCPTSLVAYAGLRRDEVTAQAHWYYRNFPPLSQHHTAVILDPMLATGGSAIAVVQELRRCGILAKNIHFTGLLGVPEGIAALSAMIPHENILLATIDEGLDAKKFIVPGLGDFGDRYFGYTPIPSKSLTGQCMDLHCELPTQEIYAR